MLRKTIRAPPPTQRQIRRRGGVCSKLGMQAIRDAHGLQSYSGNLFGISPHEPAITAA